MHRAPMGFSAYHDTSLPSFLAWLREPLVGLAHWGDLASVIGLTITIVGMAFTLRAALQSRNSADRAQEEAKQTHYRIALVNITSSIDEIKQQIYNLIFIHNDGNWGEAYEQYYIILEMLGNLRKGTQKLSDNHLEVILRFATHFNVFCQLVENAIIDGIPPGSENFNNILRSMMSALSEIKWDIMYNREG